MLIPYEYQGLLIHQENEPEIVDILRELDVDVITPEVEQRRSELLNRIDELGEERILARLGGKR